MRSVWKWSVAPATVHQQLKCPLRQVSQSFQETCTLVMLCPTLKNISIKSPGKFWQVGFSRSTKRFVQLGRLDQPRQFAETRNFPFRFHVMVWGAQQPTWLENLPQAEQVAEIKEWFAAVSTRYSGENAPRISGSGE